MRTYALLAALLALSGCSSSGHPVTEEQARAAPARLEASMGPDGDLSEMDFSVQMTMSGSQGGQEMSMRMHMTMDATFYQGGALGMEIRFAELEMSGMEGSGPAPDMSDVVMRLTCLPDRWVVETSGMAAMGEGMEDLSAETRNSTGKCDLQDSSSKEDLQRLMGTMSGGLGPGFESAFETPDYKFVRLDGNKATYRVAADDMQGMPMATGTPGEFNATATFDSEARIAKVEMDADMDMMGMAMTLHMETEYTYGSRDAAPDVHGDRKV